MIMKAIAAILLAAVLSVAAPTIVNVAGVSHQAGIAYAQNEGNGNNNQGGTDEPDGNNNDGCFFDDVCL